MRRRGGFILALLAVPLTIFYLLSRLWSPLKTFKTSAVDGRKVIVVASRKSSDVSWVHSELPDWTPAIYVVDDQTAPLHTKINKGREANVYLTYIIDNYRRLPDVTVFVHEHRNAYHIDNAFFDNPESINRLNLDHVQRVGYQSLRCHTWPSECATSDDGSFNYRDTLVLGAWQSLFPKDKLPNRLSGPNFAQFAVSRNQILARPRADYQRIHDWLMTTDKIDAESGRTLEHTWHYIFGQPAEFCIRRDKCLCDAFGFCDKKDEDVIDAIDAVRNWANISRPEGYAEWREQQKALGLNAAIWTFQMKDIMALLNKPAQPTASK